VPTTIAASVDGELLAPERATISVLDDGLQRGDGAFEMIKLYDRHPFRLVEHLDRLAASAEAIHLEGDLAALRSEIDALRARAPAGESMLRIILTRGGRRILLVEEPPELPSTARVALVELSASEILAGVKSISYAANMQATRIARARGADEAIYVDRDGTVREAPTSSVFWVGADGTLRTPALATGILDSITRRVVVDALDPEQGFYEADELRSAREAFLASTAREIQPIATVEGVELEWPTGAAVGVAAPAAAEALGAAISRERDERRLER
jgi:branched-chain amino acid aminotransferase